MGQQQRNKRKRAGKEQRGPGRENRQSGTPARPDAPVAEPVPNVVTRPGKLPESYGQTRVVVLPIHPYLVHVYWEIAPDCVEENLKRLPEVDRPPQPCLRFYDVTYIDFDGTNAHSWFDVEIDLWAGNWYVELWSANKSYCVDLGLRSPAGIFLPLARSNIAQTPPDQPSVNVTERYSFVPPENLREHVERGGTPFDLPGSEKESRLPGESQNPDEPRAFEGPQMPEETPGSPVLGHSGLTAHATRREGSEQGKRSASASWSVESAGVTEIVRQRYRELHRSQAHPMTPTTAPFMARDQEAKPPRLSHLKPQRADITQIDEQAFAFGVSSRPTSR